MICKCPQCDGALEYSPITDQMECPFCGTSYDMMQIMSVQKTVDHRNGSVYKPFGAADGLSQSADIGNSAYTNNVNTSAFGGGWESNPYAQRMEDPNEGLHTLDQPGEIAKEVENKLHDVAVDTPEMMEGNIYTCTSCGAELFINGVETATYCAYCGQPTVVFSRVSEELRPERIIPFSIQKEQAVAVIRDKLSHGFFVPKAIRNFEVERVRGIYIPYFLFDAHYYDYQKLRGVVKYEGSSRNESFIREAECEFRNLTCDASKMLNDETSQRLEPYDLNGLRPFEIGYLSGFYADRYDMNERTLKNVVRVRCKELFDNEMKMDTMAENVRILSSQPKFELKKAQYVLLPAWFMTFRYKNEPYTILVNGQTAKVVGAVPFAKDKLAAVFVAIAVVATLLFSFLGMILFNQYVDMDGRLLVMAVMGIITVYSTGIASFASVMKNIKLTKAKKTASFVKERQDET